MSRDSGYILTVVTVMAVVTIVPVVSIFVCGNIVKELPLQEYKLYQLTVDTDSDSTNSSDCRNINNSSNSLTLLKLVRNNTG